MIAKKRILTIRLAERIWNNPDYAKKIGVSVEISKTNTTENKTSTA